MNITLEEILVFCKWWFLCFCFVCGAWPGYSQHSLVRFKLYHTQQSYKTPIATWFCPKYTYNSQYSKTNYSIEKQNLVASYYSKYFTGNLVLYGTNVLVNNKVIHKTSKLLAYKCYVSKLEHRKRLTKLCSKRCTPKSTSICCRMFQI